MATLILAAAAASMIHLTLESGATVAVDYSPKEMSEADATQKALKIGRWIWNDFCGSPGEIKCNSDGSYYSISLGLSPNYCLATIEGKMADFTSSVHPSKYREAGDYRCSTDLEVYRDSNPDTLDIH